MCDWMFLEKGAACPILLKSHSVYSTRDPFKVSLQEIENSKTYTQNISSTLAKPSSIPQDEEGTCHFHDCVEDPQPFQSPLEFEFLHCASCV